MTTSKGQYEVGFKMGQESANVYKKNPFVEVSYDEHLMNADDPSDFIQGYKDGFNDKVKEIEAEEKEGEDTK